MRPDRGDMQTLVMTEQQFTQKCVALVGDGASVNGLNVSHGAGRVRTPIEVARWGDNVFHHLSTFKARHSPIALLGL